MADLKEKAIALLSSVATVDLGSTGQTTIYTVPVGKKCVLDHARIRCLSGDAKATVVTFGQVGALTDFLGAQTLVALNAAAATGKLEVVPNASTVIAVEYTAGTVLQIDVTTASGDGGGTPTATVELFGMIDDA